MPQQNCQYMAIVLYSLVLVVDGNIFQRNIWVCGPVQWTYMPPGHNYDFIKCLFELFKHIFTNTSLGLGIPSLCCSIKCALSHVTLALTSIQSIAVVTVSGTCYKMKEIYYNKNCVLTKVWSVAYTYTYV